MEVVRGIAFAVSALVLAAMALLASVAFRGGEPAGQHRLAAVPPPALARRSARGRIVNQVLVWGLALTLLAATLLLIVAAIAYDALT